MGREQRYVIMASRPSGAAISSSYAAPMMARIVRSVPPPTVGYVVSFRRPAAASKCLCIRNHVTRRAHDVRMKPTPCAIMKSIRATTRVYEELREGITAIREKNP